MKLPWKAELVLYLIFIFMLFAIFWIIFMLGVCYLFNLPFIKTFLFVGKVGQALTLGAVLILAFYFIKSKVDKMLGSKS